VHIIRVAPAHWYNGKYYEARERLAGNEAFGKWAWSFGGPNKKELAVEKFNALVQRPAFGVSAELPAAESSLPSPPGPPVRTAPGGQSRRPAARPGRVPARRPPLAAVAGHAGGGAPRSLPKRCATNSQPTGATPAGRCTSSTSRRATSPCRTAPACGSTSAWPSSGAATPWTPPAALLARRRPAKPTVRRCRTPSTNESLLRPPPLIGCSLRQALGSCPREQPIGLPGRPSP
jgi:hypothetical protein